MEARIAVITVSDTRTPESDESGPAVIAELEKLGFSQFESRIIRDEVDEIRAAILSVAATCDAVFTTGGTGFTPRDVTPEATAPLLERRADNLVELMRLRGSETTPFAHLSRGVAGMIGSCLVVNLPGSPKGARESIEALAPILPHVLEQLRGSGCGHQ